MQEFDELVVLEDLLVETLPLGSEVDAHDLGRGEFNIFILTDQPEQTFHAAEQRIQLCDSLAPDTSGIHNHLTEAQQPPDVTLLSGGG